MIRWKCPHCQSTLGAPEWAISRRVPCPVCTNGIKIPPVSEDDPEFGADGKEKKKTNWGCGCIIVIIIFIFVVIVLSDLIQ